MNNFVLASSNIAAQVSIGALKATVILVLASAIAHCLRRQSAATRHMVWTSSLVGAISVLLLPLILPAWRVLPSPLVNTRLTRTTPSLSPNSQMPAHRTRDSREETMSSAALSSPEQKTSVAQSPVTLPSALIATIRNWKMLLSCVWLAGVLTLVARYSRSDWVMSRVLQQATPLPEGRCADLLSRIMRQWRVTRPVALAESHDVDLPIAYGTLRPRIVLPVEASEWSLQRCEYVLQHELAHVRRLDACTQFVSQIASAIFWFHPLIWYACRQMRFERERACDDYVLASGAQASDYASDLLAMVQCYGCCGEHPTALAMLRRSQFEGRLCALLDQRLRRDVLSRSKLMCGTVVAALLVVPLAVVRGANPRQTPAAAPQSLQSPTPAMQLAASPAPAQVIHSAAPAAQVRAVVNSNDDIFAGCGSDKSRHSNRSNSDRDDSTWSASGTMGDCRYDLYATGRIGFNEEATALERISSGGSLEVSTNIRGETTILSAKPANDGSITYKMTRNGIPVDFAREGRAWLAGFLVTLDRRTAFAVDYRLPKLLRDGGPRAALDEVSRMPVSHAKTEYLIQLMQQAALGPEDLRRLLQLAAAPQSDHNTSRVLAIAAQKLDSADDSVREEFLRACVSLTSESERARVLGAFLLRASPTREQSAAIIMAANSIKSDYQKGRILIALAMKQPLEGDLLPVYLASAQTIQSVFERQRVLAAVGR